MPGLNDREDPLYDIELGNEKQPGSKPAPIAQAVEAKSESMFSKIGSAFSSSASFIGSMFSANNQTETKQVEAAPSQGTAAAKIGVGVLGILTSWALGTLGSLMMIAGAIIGIYGIATKNETAKKVGLGLIVGGVAIAGALPLISVGLCLEGGANLVGVKSNLAERALGVISEKLSSMSGVSSIVNSVNWILEKISPSKTVENSKINSNDIENPAARIEAKQQSRMPVICQKILQVFGKNVASVDEANNVETQALKSVKPKADFKSPFDL